MFEILPNTNRTRVLFSSVRCGAELEQTEHVLENVLFCLFVRLAISEWQYMMIMNTIPAGDPSLRRTCVPWVQMYDAPTRFHLFGFDSGFFGSDVDEVPSMVV